MCHLETYAGAFQHDHVALAEIELYVEVLTAVATADERLSAEELDRVLGVPPRPPLRETHTPSGRVIRRRRALQQL
ncbi:hypothetical protein CLV63_103247 [Murinocardiopsis flavida]|uniref:Uncharacterized protein n=1 Tax=Murinocardiopsis flavida TaxID=645275 RepID=A0A2P8DQP6_9ACTN|nr:hypothetical protein [Murinocardiopsis flavida]PSK99522.1 hypothetical protein CLV63_103247 [Murinocardiopsis flavida]